MVTTTFSKPGMVKNTKNFVKIPINTKPPRKNIYAAAEEAAKNSKYSQNNYLKHQYGNDFKGNSWLKQKANKLFKTKILGIHENEKITYRNIAEAMPGSKPYFNLADSIQRARRKRPILK